MKLWQSHNRLAYELCPSSNQRHCEDWNTSSGDLPDKSALLHSSGEADTEHVTPGNHADMNNVWSSRVNSARNPTTGSEVHFHVENT